MTIEQRAWIDSYVSFFYHMLNGDPGTKTKQTALPQEMLEWLEIEICPMHPESITERNECVEENCRCVCEICQQAMF